MFNPRSTFLKRFTFVIAGDVVSIVSASIDVDRSVIRKAWMLWNSQGFKRSPNGNSRLVRAVHIRTENL